MDVYILILCCIIAAPVALYVLVRFGSAAYFKSKFDFLRSGDGIREKEKQ